MKSIEVSLFLDGRGTKILGKQINNGNLCRFMNLNLKEMFSIYFSWRVGKINEQKSH
jgi:hypothetical protein